MNKVSKMFGGNSVFKELSLEIKQGDRVGVVGRNGSGKTTIFKLISGLESTDEGDIHIKKGAVCGYLAQVPDVEQTMTVYSVLETAFEPLIKLKQELQTIESHLATIKNETELAKMLKVYGKLQEQFQLEGGYEIEAKIQKVSQGLDLTSMHDQLFHLLSGGEKTKVGLGFILLKEADLLLLDEPTNHLDIEAVEWLEDYLQNYEGTIMLISHDRAFLDKVITKTIDIEDGEAHVYHGNYSNFVKEKEERLMAEFALYQEQEKKIKKMKETIKRLKEWANQANPPNEGLHKRAKSMEKALERMEKVKRPNINPRKMALDFSIHERSGQDVVVLDEVSYGYENKKLLFKNISLKIRFKERVAIVGNNGTGKSTLLKLILGELTPLNGEVKLGSQVHVGYLSQHDFEADNHQTVLEAFRECVPVTEGEARHILAKFLFYGFAVFNKVNRLSGGERMRLRLAQLMHQNINLLILDEPTNHLDIDSREVLEEAIDQFDGTIIAVSHDRYFLNKCFNTTLWLFSQSLVKFEGNYNDAKKKKERLYPKGDSNDKPYDNFNKIKMESHSVQQVKLPQINNIEGDIEDCEAMLATIETDMMVESSLDRLAELQQVKEELESKRNNLYKQLESSMEDDIHNQINRSSR